MRYILIISLAALAACSSAGAQEEEKYRMVVRSTEGKFKPYVARCEQAKLVAAAYLADRDEANYGKWKAAAELDCGLTDVMY